MGADLPAAAAWRHEGAREGFEVTFFRGAGRIEGQTTAVEDGRMWAVRYALSLDPGWRTRSAHVTGWSDAGTHEVQLEGDGDGAWLVDSAPAPELAGCLDVDLEASAFTNALPIHRLALKLGEQAEAPAAYVRAPDLRVERLEQRYVRLDGGRYDYEAPDLGFRAVLAYDELGLVLDYPGIATRR